MTADASFADLFGGAALPQKGEAPPGLTSQRLPMFQQHLAKHLSGLAFLTRQQGPLRNLWEELLSKQHSTRAALLCQHGTRKTPA